MKVQSVEKTFSESLLKKHFGWNILPKRLKNIWVEHFAKNLQNVYYLSVLSENMVLLACMCDKGL